MPTCPMCSGRTFEGGFCKKCGMPEPEKAVAKKSASMIRGAPAGQRLRSPSRIGSEPEKPEGETSSPPESSSTPPAKAQMPVEKSAAAAEDRIASSAARLPQRAPSQRGQVASRVEAAPRAQVAAVPRAAPPPGAPPPGSPPPPGAPPAAGAAREDASFQLQACPSCKAALPNPPGKFCDACGLKLPMIRKAIEAVRSEDDDDASRLCSGCGSRLRRGRKNCPNCGTPVKSED